MANMVALTNDLNPKDIYDALISGDVITLHDKESDTAKQKPRTGVFLYSY
jgi:hypothetical protein